MDCIRSSRPRRAAWTTALALAIAVGGAFLLGIPAARAAEQETRIFSITVDGKKAGEYKMVIHKQADGSLALYASSEVRVTVLAVPVYTYSYGGHEVWKDGRLVAFVSKGKEKSKEFSIRANSNGVGIHVVANGKEHDVSADVWTTSCWQLPPAAYRNHAITMLGCDTGADYASQLTYVGTEKIAVAGQEMSCTHYRVQKDVPHDVWYDAQERLVRDEWVSNGHRTVLEMAELR
jgi:hypothetical protein